ncbi:MAG: 50S ribosomal protein L21 [Chloroflexi bacterium]|nr:50S ribosomal protein L21 [Chloroflexota bacterium]
MRFAIVESGGKQYRAVEGSTIEVDRMPVEPGKKFDLESVLLMADGEEVMVGTPTVSGIQVKATVVDHFKGPKVVRFKYRPKKRIRVKGGHRHQYTRLMIDFIGRPGEERTLAPHASAGEVEKPIVKEEAEAPVEMAEAETKVKAEKQAKAPKKEAGKSSAKKTEKAPAKKSVKKTEKK